MTFYNTKSKRIGLVLILLYATLIAFLSLTPGTESDPWFPHDDKVMHFFAYAAFFVLCLPFAYKHAALLFCAISIFLYSVLMEFGQSFVPLRDMSFLDAVANAAGIAAGSMITLKLRARALLKLS